MKIISDSIHTSFQKKLLLALAIVIGLVMSFGILAGMGMDANGDMIGCPMMPETSVVCDMGIVEHIGHWKIITASILQDFGNLIAFAFISFIVFSFLFQKFSQNSGLKWGDVCSSVWKLFNYLIQAFARGILHPKIYPVLN